ncbi:hypothetical protein BCEN4_440098 [Burkholderia cenocepacia]|nr:hypothetical protein BCEN4_440098 [Burkholderia cenocepacia]
MSLLQGTRTYRQNAVALPLKFTRRILF